MQDALPPAESRPPEPSPPPIDAPALPPQAPPTPEAAPVQMDAPRSSAELLQPTVVATAPPPPPPPTAAPAPAPSAAPPTIEKGRWWAVFSHLMLFAAIPTIFLGGVVTFFLWQILGKDDQFVEDQAREALNFQINIALLSLLLAATFVGVPLVILLWVVACIICLIAALHASRGERYRYPAILRIVSH